jgi:hypothetical protein
VLALCRFCCRYETQARVFWDLGRVLLVLLSARGTRYQLVYTVLKQRVYKRVLHV